MGEGLNNNPELNNDKDVIAIVEELFGSPKTPLNAQSPLTLAFVGDAVYSLIIRTIVVNEGNTSNGKLHKKSTGYVSAAAQAQMAKNWLEAEILTEEEQAVLKRGINAKPHSLPKNASPADYHKATGVEALAGYLYLKGDIKRLTELIKTGLRQ